MELDRRNGRIWAAAALGLVATLLFARLASFGIWDPWELNPADQARHLLAGEEVSLTGPTIPPALVALGFGAFGIREWAGRLPMAVLGLGAAWLAYLLVRRFAGRRAGVYAALITGTSPLFLFNSRQMLGDAAAFATQALIALGAMAALYRPTLAEDATEKRRWTLTALWLLAAGAGVWLAIGARGALLGALAPLLAVAAVACLQGTALKPQNPQQRMAVYVLVGLSAIVLAFVATSVIADRAEYSVWLGGHPRGGDPPTFEVGIESIFHSFAPWSALLPLALGRMLLPWARDTAGQAEEGDEPSEEAQARAAFRPFVLLWITFGYGALTLFTARYGPGTFVPVVALGAAVALLLRDAEHSETAWWSAAVVSALFIGLLIRDFGLYPAAPVAGLGIEAVTVPEVFNPKRIWTALMGAFAVAAVLGFSASPGATMPDSKDPYRLLRAQLKRGWAEKAWVLVMGVALLLLVLFGVLCFVAGEWLMARLGLPSVVVRTAQLLALVPLAIPIVILIAQWIRFAFGLLGGNRLLPLLAAGAVVGAYAAQGFLPALSSHFSPREVYDTFNALSSPGEPLGEYRVGGRAAAYYAHGEVVDIDNQQELVAHLTADERRWAAFPSDELAAVDRDYRRRNGEHLFVADARSARVVLVSNQPVEGVTDQSFVAEFVLDEPPAIQHEVGAVFEDKITLLGYDLDLPQEGYVGAGESFTITWYWRAEQAVPGGWKPFVHIDGHGQRLNGDHDPVDGRYPVRLWDEGDVVKDVQELAVPANYRPGAYTIFTGLYAGNNRLSVSEGPKDDADRVRAGVLTVR